MLFDSHTHINNEGYSEDEVIALAKKIEESNVSYVMDVGFDLASSVAAVKHSEKYTWCYAAVGCHPHEVKSMDQEQLVMFKGMANKEKVKAIGEIGLDYFRNHSPREEQQIWFRRQIKLANELKMPIIIHDRDANQDVIDILKEECAFSKERCSWFPLRKGPGIEMLKDARVLLHCYSGSRELAEQYIKLGATISIAGPITYKNNRKGVEVAAAIPIEFLLIETDAPYLTPEPLRGHQNMSPYIAYTAEKLAEIKGISIEEVSEMTCNNAKVFFGINV
jgi:TatD DNase family protein